MTRSQLKCLQLLTINFLCLLSLIESSPVQRESPVVYRRYVRKRPSSYVGDSYMEEVHEIFETRYRPPQFNTFNDDEIDQLIRCDFEPHLKECEDLQKKQENPIPVLPPRRPIPTRPTYTKTSTVSMRPLETTTKQSTTIVTSITPTSSQPLPTRTALNPYKPTPAIDLNQPEIIDEDSIPTLPPDSEDYDEEDIDYGVEKVDEYEAEDFDKEHNDGDNEVDTQYGDDY